MCGKWQNVSPVIAKEDYYPAAKDILAALHYKQDGAH